MNCAFPCCICCVAEQHVAVVTKLGAYDRMHRAGGPHSLHCIYESVQSYVSLQQQQIAVTVRTKVNKAEVTLEVQVQYKIIDDDEQIRSAVFKLDSPKSQIEAYVQDALRSAVSDLTVEQVFDSKDEIAREVFTALDEKMREYGFEIVNTLVTDVLPPATIMNSFDLNNLNKYSKEADKFQQMLDASYKNTNSSAQKERSKIIGEGISQQRQEIVNGLKNSIDQFTEQISGVSPQDVLELVLVTQYFDMLKDVGVSPQCKVFFTPGGESSAANIRDAILQAKD